MCFSVNVNLVKDELESRYGVSFPDHNRYQPSYYYHAFSLPELPSICSGSTDKIQLLRWGLIPSWTRNSEEADSIRYKTFNARAESIRSKPSFSKPFRSNRCIIPVTGFFEWQHVGNDKIPWYIYCPDEEIFSIAGVFDQWIENNSGEIYNTFSIITTDANELMAVIHNSKKRMPVILQRENEKKWINSDISPDDAHSLLQPCPSEFLKAHTIGDLVNNRSANRNNPDVIRPFPRESNRSLF
jgi:putative SOS response-associated peptidase YedK